MGRCSVVPAQLPWQQCRKKPNLHYSLFTMDDGLLEFLAFCYARVYVERVDITTKAIEEGLARISLASEDMIRFSRWDFWQLSDEPFAFETKSTESPQEESRVIIAD